MVVNSNDDRDPIDVFTDELQEDLEQSRRALRETTMMIEQSQAELAKLVQRNASVTGHLQQMQPQFETLARNDIRMAYNAALDTQQRLLVMRGQLEKLQAEQKNLQRYISQLEHIMEVMQKTAGGKGSRSNSLAMLEMVVKVQEAERLRLSRQMHDGPAQALSNFIVQTEIAMRYFEMDPAKAKEELMALKQSAFTTFQKVRTFIFELRPMMLDDLGVVPTIRRYAETFKEQTGIDVLVSVTGNERRMPSYIEVLIFRAMQELLGHAVHQNQATHIKVLLNVDEKIVKLSIDDNGKGYDTETMGKDEYLGQKMLKERVEFLGGNWAVDSSPGMGTRVSCIIPMQAPNPMK